MVYEGSWRLEAVTVTGCLERVEGGDCVASLAPLSREH